MSSFFTTALITTNFEATKIIHINIKIVINFRTIYNPSKERPTASLSWTPGACNQTQTCPSIQGTEDVAKFWSALPGLYQHLVVRYDKMILILCFLKNRSKDIQYNLDQEISFKV
jgi:hypothetical protein